MILEVSANVVVTLSGLWTRERPMLCSHALIIDRSMGTRNKSYMIVVELSVGEAFILEGGYNTG